MIRRLGAGLILAALFAWGMALALWVGGKGFHPLDSCIVFDGAYRVLCGQVPYRDFLTPHSLTSILIQAVWFKLFGVSWLVYSLGAAVLNGLFVLIIYRSLRVLGATQLSAGVFAACSGVTFYAVTGTPFMVQDSCFFLALSLLLMLESSHARGKRLELVFAALAGAALVLGILSKPIPAGIGVIVLPAAALLYRPLAARRIIASTIAGAVLTCALFVLAAKLAGADFRELYEVAIKTSFTIGAQRLQSGASNVPTWQRLTVIPLQWRLICTFAVPFAAVVITSKWRSAIALVGLALAALSIVTAMRADLQVIRRGAMFAAAYWLALAAFAWLRGRSTTLNEDQRSRAHVTLALLILAGAAVASTLANVRAVTGVALNFFCVGLIQVAFLQVSSKPLRWAPKALILLVLLDAAIFWSRVDLPHIAILIDHSASDTPLAAPISPRLAHLHWDAPHEINPDMQRNLSDYAQFAALLRAGGNFALFGDTSILYAVTDRPSVAPSLFFHEGVGTPLRNTPAAERYQRRFIANLQRYQCRYFVIERENGTIGVNYADFPILQEYVSAHTAAESRIGPLRVIELSPPEPSGR